MTQEQVRKVEAIVSEQIRRDLLVSMQTMTIEEARAAGAIALFGEKYGEKVKVYTVGDFSKDVCGGPHVERAGVLGKFAIQEEQSSLADVRRIRAVLKQRGGVASGRNRVKAGGSSLQGSCPERSNPRAAMSAKRVTVVDLSAGS